MYRYSRGQDPDAIRPDPLDENELARFKSLQRVKPERLPAMLPAWIKKHAAAHSLPKQFEFIPNQPPVYPTSIEGWRGERVNLFTIQTKPFLKIPGYETKESDYISTFDDLNNLVPLTYVYPKGD